MNDEQVLLSPRQQRAEMRARRAARREAQFAATKAGRLMQTMTRLAKDQNPLALAFG